MTDTRFRPTNAMILAAGLGKRMRPLTATTPKPLIEVNGQALIDHGMDRLAAAGVKKCVVNVHYLADLVEVHVRRRLDMDIVISDERAQLLETGGGIKNALPLLGKRSFFPAEFGHLLLG
jgi:MurNAc alpha-1-phosphate uridylyltransferase